MQLGGVIPQIHKAVFPGFLRLLLRLVRPDQVGVGKYLRRRNSQLEARVLYHQRVLLKLFFRRRRGHQIHGKGPAVVVVVHFQKAVVEHILFPALVDEIVELVRKVDFQMLHRHGGHGQPFGERHAVWKHQRALFVRKAVFFRHLFQKFTHRLHRNDGSSVHIVVRQRFYGHPKHAVVLALRHLHLPGTDLNSCKTVRHLPSPFRFPAKSRGPRLL